MSFWELVGLHEGSKTAQKNHCWYTPQNSILTHRMLLPCIPQAPDLPWFLGNSSICSSVTFHSGCCSSIFFSQRGLIFQGLCGNIFPLLFSALTHTLLFSWPGNCNPSSAVTAGSLLGRNYHWHENHPCSSLLCRFQFILDKTHTAK